MPWGRSERPAGWSWRRRTAPPRSPRRDATRRAARVGEERAVTERRQRPEVELLLHPGGKLPSWLVASPMAATSRSLGSIESPKRQRVARVANSSSRSMTAKARSGTSSKTRFWRMKSAHRSGATVGTWRGSGRSSVLAVAVVGHPGGATLDGQALDRVVDGDGGLRVGGEVGRLAGAGSAREGEPVLVVVPDAPGRQGMGPAVDRGGDDPVVAPPSSLAAAHDHGSGDQSGVSTP